MAAILLQLMKMKSQLTREAADAENPRVLNELRKMTQLYLADKLGAGGMQPRRRQSGLSIQCEVSNSCFAAGIFIS